MLSSVTSSSARSIRSSRMSGGRVLRKESSAPPAPRGKSGDLGGIKVAVRFRPLRRQEKERGDTSVWGVDEANNVGVFIKGNFSPKYHYDTVFQQDQDNQFVYNTVASDIVSTAMGGINGTIFAYGVTSSGKTHTMMGYDGELGIVPRTIQHVFELIEQSPGNEYLLRLSMMEIYNEVLNDLFDPKKTNLKVREHKTKGVHVDGLTEVELESVEQALNLIETGNANRRVSATLVNNESSRSHTLCRISIEVNDKSGSSNGRTLSFLNLIDLAGSESARAAASKGHRVEGSFINKSLLTLGTVIHKLSEAKGKKNHIPFRDSKLTRLLQSSLSGSGAKMAVICCVTPTSSQAEETHNTLKFASRAKKIEIKTTKNELLDQKSLLARYQREIADLKLQLKEMAQKAAAAISENTVPAPDPKLQEELTNMRERLEEELHARMQREDDRAALNKRIERLTRLILHSTRAQAENRTPVRKLTRSRSYDALIKIDPIFEPQVRKDVLAEFHMMRIPEDLSPPPPVADRRSFCSEINNSYNSVNHSRVSVPNSLRCPSVTTIAVPGELDRETQLSIDSLRDELIEVRKMMAEKDKELEMKDRETKELRKKLASYEDSNPCSSRSLASEGDGGELEYMLLEADRGHLEDSLTVVKKEKRRLTDELLRVKIDLKRTKKKLQEYEGESIPPERQVFRGGGSSGYFPQSPSSSTGSARSRISESGFSSDKLNSEERPPRHPTAPAAGSSSEPQIMSHAEMQSKVERLTLEVKHAFEQLAAKESKIEAQKNEILNFKDESLTYRNQLMDLASENERLKHRVQKMTSEQDRCPEGMAPRSSPLSTQQVNNSVGLDSPSKHCVVSNELLLKLYDTLLGGDF
eukprot:g7943.t2